MPNLHIEILLQDDLSESWIDWFDGLNVEKTEEKSTCLSSDLPDYPALYGLLERIRDLNLHLVSVQVQPIPSKGNQ